ncbi:Mrx3p [Lachancea thermotolerans CBS 6340]|uniref:KLTH0C05830p n=1 Tax=Lachancea thermotolerans (strain ATCC 56472 / CBS 6340 / NRRL Y-8284) TaxID=559295 RepID=C5DE29_LACTC|nr:KLTH0C05830p [Lachancea thermotolerans CBS 6340]CAR22040.1 KLTH0C05830p [Lachancea thermotolerans CBS 6340]
MSRPFLARYIAVPAAGFALGFATFLRAWPTPHAGDDGPDNETLQSATLKRPAEQQRLDILEHLQQHRIYADLIRRDNIQQWSQSERITRPHRDYHVGQGLLYGPGSLEIDPLVLHDPDAQELVVFYHLGRNLANEKGAVHKGVISLLLDEALCYCGFPSLPSKSGVTARLDLQFHQDVPTDCTVVLKARVQEARGRKCIITGSLHTLPSRPWYRPFGGESSKTLATATCVLVEPKWFKYVKWLNAI